MADDRLFLRARRASRAVTRLNDGTLRRLRIQATRPPVFDAIALLEERGRGGRSGRVREDVLGSLV